METSQWKFQKTLDFGNVLAETSEASSASAALAISLNIDLNHSTQYR